MVIAIPNSNVVDVAASGRPKKRHNARWRGLALGATLAGASLYYQSTRAKPLRRLRPEQGPLARPRLHHFAVDAICGAVGEVAGLVALYPLDTIKVKCQAGGIGARQALREVLAQGPSAAMRTLYAGMGSTALGAAAIGSLYLLTFYAAKRAGTSLSRLAAAKAQQQNNSTSTEAPPSPWVASAAGAAASIVGSLIEAPIEAFKVRAQAGTGDGPMLISMARLAMTQGLAPLYCSFVPYLLKAIPHDVSELFTFSQISDQLAYSSATGRGPGAALSQMRPEAKDMLVGAASGAAGAIVSMPFDVIFTRMNLGACSVRAAAGGSGHGVAAFGAVARSIVATGGPKALFTGLVPRLFQCVPAGIVYWVAVEATRRSLENRFEIERPVVDGDMPNTLHGHTHHHAIPTSNKSSSFSSAAAAFDVLEPATIVAPQPSAAGEAKHMLEDGRSMVSAGPVGAV